MAISLPAGTVVVDPAYLAEQIEAAVARKDWVAIERLGREARAVDVAIEKEKRRAAAPRRVMVKG